MNLTSTRIPRPLLAALVGTFGIFTYGLVLLRLDPPGFSVWIREDGLAEWLTFAALLAGAVFAVVRAIALRKDGAPGARAVWIIGALAFFFGAMEEISWGQRVIGWESPPWFVMHNDQHETNIHNLKVLGVKVNKLVFGKMLAVFVIAYLSGLPLLHAMQERARRAIDRLAIPVPQIYQIVLWVAAAIAIELSKGIAPRDRVRELLEFAGSVLFLAIIVHPRNERAIALDAEGKKP